MAVMKWILGVSAMASMQSTCETLKYEDMP